MTEEFPVKKTESGKPVSQFKEYLREKDMDLNESSQHARYSVEVNYRSTFDEVADAFAKLCLGYVSAALKSSGYHCKTVFDAKPYRVLVGTRNWDDGEWIAIATFCHKDHHFHIGEGNYNKDKKTVSIHRKRKSDKKTASEITKELRNMLERLKRTNPVRSSSLLSAPLKRGPKKSLKIKKTS